ncbi:response regulator [Paenibacillus anaericanus]|uniref:Response regulator n=1 Tax=Paenibacillus anaericanus TaxID=170367 RepID=A0A433Y4W7_9BACL|nr:response regulator [Paenibacillus anaericanus]RUT43423.1 response regulator [Paenibacillus anaericanus]
MKVLVVDDEPRHLRGMLRLINHLRPDAQVIVTKDGIDALELVRSDRPDVVFTDIRMPNMDGLTFLQQLKKEGLHTKVVMVSAYNLFEYAQTAVRHGAYDYLLKPVEAEKIEDVLRRIEQELVTESMQNLEAEELKQRLDLTSSAYSNRLLLTWLNGSSTTLERNELKSYDWLQGGGVVIFSELRIRRDSNENYDNAYFLRSLEQGWSAIGESITIPLNVLQEDGFQAVTIIRTPPLTPGHRHHIRIIVSALSSEWANVGQLTHGIGPECKFLLEEASQAYRVAQTVNKYNFHDCWKGILFQDELRPSHKLLTLDTERLFEALQGNDADIAIEMCRVAFEQLSDGGHTNPLLMKENASLILMKVKSRIRDIVDKKVGSLLTNTAMMHIQACGSNTELLALLEVSLQKVHAALKQAKLDKTEIIVTSCLSWIHERLKEDLTLERAAEHFFFNPSYFSTLIKSRTGKTFSDHVTEARMRQAKVLLAANKLRIYEISAECGYQDTKYFCRVFKKHNGMSPEAYRHTSLPQRSSEE